MKDSYPGPVRDEPLALELHNTLYAVRGEAYDGLATDAGLASWLEAISPRLPAQARGAAASRRMDFLALRDAIREALQATVEDRPVLSRVIEAINAAAAAAPVSPVARSAGRHRLRRERRYGTDDQTDVALAVIASDAIELLTGARRDELRACRAPGCVLKFVKQHPRQQWCSIACGNRARQARHYRRTHKSG
jgi:predicted RNA-binding Zn ribbon-like protein